MVFILYSAILTPVRIAFTEGDNVEIAWNVIGDFVFIFDLCIQFITAREESNGTLIIDKKQIAMSYLQSWFIIDLIAAIPINLIILMFLTGKKSQTAVSFKLNKLLKLFQLYRIVSITKLSKLAKNNKYLDWLTSRFAISDNFSELFKNLSRMIMLIHLIGSIWAIVGTMYVADKLYNWMRNPEATIIDASGIEKYFTSCYWAVVTICTVGYGEIHPYNNIEVAANIMVMWIGVTIQSYIMSRVTMIFNSTKPLEF